MSIDLLRLCGNRHTESIFICIQWLWPESIVYKKWETDSVIINSARGVPLKQLFLSLESSLDFMEFDFKSTIMDNLHKCQYLSNSFLEL